MFQLGQFVFVGLAWFGLVVVWVGLILSDSVWSAWPLEIHKFTHSTNSVWAVQICSDSFAMIWSDKVWHNMVVFSLVWTGLVVFSLLWFGLTWFV